MAQTINVTELSEMLETSPRTARKFLRSHYPVEVQPGKGGRWSIKKAEVRTLKKKFQEWSDTHTRVIDVPEDTIDDSEVESE